LKFQLWFCYIESQSSIIKAQFLCPEPHLIDRLNLPARGAFVTMPSLSGASGFNGASVGYEAASYHMLHFDTINEQDPDRFNGIVSIKMYDGGAVVPRLCPRYKTIDIGGVTKSRLVIGCYNDMTGGQMAANWPTFLPNTRRIGIQFMGFLR
jgi:hypothetical protein